MPENPCTPFLYERRVAFADTDMAGIVHFSRLLDYVEEAEHALFREFGIPITGTESLWPRLRLEVDFLSPTRFTETVHVELRITKIGKSSLTFDFEIRQVERPICRGKWIICHSRFDDAGTLRAAAIPDEYIALLSH